MAKEEEKRTSEFQEQEARMILLVSLSLSERVLADFSKGAQVKPGLSENLITCVGPIN